MSFFYNPKLKLYIPENRLSHHIQNVGAPGTRKSSLIRGFVRQAKQRGWPCVFTDLKGEYFDEFYEEGDYLIDFMDERCPRWMIGYEALDEPSGMTLGEGAFPDEAHRAFFFQDHSRAILGYLEGVHHFSTSELSRILINEDLLDRMLRGTEHAGTIKKNSPEQRNGILGTLNHLGRPMRWMPDEQGRREFCVREWAAMGPERTGSIFLRSTPLTFPGLRPMQSLILDLALLGAMTYPGPCLFVLDEIGEFQRSPQLRRAMAMMRSSGSVIILGYQGFTQLEKVYGPEDAETIMTSAYTNFVMATSGKRSAEFSSALLGLPSEIKRGRPSTSRRLFDTPLSERVSMIQENTMVPAVTPGQIQCLEDGRGFMAQRGVIVPINVDYNPPIVNNVQLIERYIPESTDIESEPQELRAMPKPVVEKPHKSKYTRSHEQTQVCD